MSNEVTGKKGRNNKNGERSEERNPHVQHKSLWPQPHENENQVRVQGCELGAIEKHILRLHKNTLHHEHNDQTGRWLRN